MHARSIDSLAVLVGLLASLGLFACSSPGPGKSPVHFRGSSLVLPFGSCSAHDDQIFATAQLERNSKAEFGIDLLERHRILAVRLDVKRARGNPGGRGEPELSEPTLHPQCFLENGLYLEPVTPAELRSRLPKKYRDSIQSKALQYNKIDDVDSSLSGYLYFNIPKDYRIEDTRLRLRDPYGAVHEVDMLRSLLRFRYNYIDAQASELRDFYVGLR